MKFSCICYKILISNSLWFKKHESFHHIVLYYFFGKHLITFKLKFFNFFWFQKHDSSQHILCLYCLKVFVVKFVSQGWGQTQTYYGHLLKHQSKSGSKKCSSCRLTFVNPADCKNHKKKDHAANQKGIGTNKIKLCHSVNCILSWLDKPKYSSMDLWSIIFETWFHEEEIALKINSFLTCKFLFFSPQVPAPGPLNKTWWLRCRSLGNRRWSLSMPPLLVRCWTLGGQDSPTPSISTPVWSVRPSWEHLTTSGKY